MYKQYEQYLSILRNTGKYRRLPEIRQDNRESYLDFSTNDYLALSKNSEIIEAGIAASKEYGAGSTGSRLLSGNSILYEMFEAKIAKDKNTETALVFNSGFQANLSTLSALLDKHVLGQTPIVFFDKNNHSSLYQAIFLSGSELVRYNHNDLNQLESLLDKYKDDNRSKFIVTETIFGMDGDIAPIEQIIIIARKYKAFLYLDEAHATGIFGREGYGLSTEVDLADIPYVVMGTFSKALGCSGGYIACARVLQDYLINKASGFIYSTAPSPFVIGSALKAWDIIRTLDYKRKKLLHYSKFLRAKLLEVGLDIGNSNTHIIPIILKQDYRAIQAKEKLLENKIIVSAIRPPTVPPNSSRLRIALTTDHQEQDIDQLVQILMRVL
jgi:8-amino-7-oxononanoate synthase